MPTLYTYCIPYDDGAAPNPYWGICTLVICKPVIRRPRSAIGSSAPDRPIHQSVTSADAWSTRCGCHGQ